MVQSTSHEQVAATNYDVIIVGSGFTGANMAYVLASEPNNKKVLIIEAGPGIERSREDYMENFYLNTFKSPSSPYPPNDNNAFMTNVTPADINVPRATIQDLVGGWTKSGNSFVNDPKKSYLTYTDGSKPFASTYERLAGGTGNHWMGTCLRMSPLDLATNTYFDVGRDWPLKYEDLTDFYDQAEHLIGVSADVQEQNTAVGTEWTSVGSQQFTDGYEYPMQPITASVVDQSWSPVNGVQLTNDNPNTAIVSRTPAGRNSEPYMNRRACHGNTNCTPICPIQAKYDPQFTLSLAMDTGNVDMISKSVVDYIDVAEDGRVNTIHYITYDSIAVPATSGSTGNHTITIDFSSRQTVVVLAAHAIENAKILLNSARKTGKNIANSSHQLGLHLMDHPTFLAWGLFTSKRCYGYRGPISTSGIENLRTSLPTDANGFRKNRAPWRIEIGNEAWNWPVTDPYTTALDKIYGTNVGGLNVTKEVIGNANYWQSVNGLLTRQFRMAFLVEQPASPSNKIELSGTHTDNLGIPRPEITYDLDDYTKEGFVSAAEATSKIMEAVNAGNYTTFDPNSAAQFDYGTDQYNYQGAGHVCGTHIMGQSPTNSVVNSYQRSWDHSNLYICGCGSMPSIGTENPTLTMLAIGCRSAQDIA